MSEGEILKGNCGGKTKGNYTCPEVEGKSGRKQESRRGKREKNFGSVSFLGQLITNWKGRRRRRRRRKKKKERV